MSKIVGIGTDIIEISRIEKSIKNSRRFLARVFTENEIKYATARGNRPETYAGMFAAKEAAVKAVGGRITGYEVLHCQSGKPYILHNSLKIKLSISHCKSYATAFVIAVKQ